MNQQPRPRGKLIEIETRAGEAVDHNGTRIIPFATSYQIRLPFWRQGGVIYNRPVSVHVTQPDGQEQTLPIVDVTRMAQLSALVGSVMVVVILWLLTQKNK